MGHFVCHTSKRLSVVLNKCMNISQGGVRFRVAELLIASFFSEKINNIRNVIFELLWG